MTGTTEKSSLSPRKSATNKESSGAAERKPIAEIYNSPDRIHYPSTYPVPYPYPTTTYAPFYNMMNALSHPSESSVGHYAAFAAAAAAAASPLRYFPPHPPPDPLWAASMMRAYAPSLAAAAAAAATPSSHEMIGSKSQFGSNVSTPHSSRLGSRKATVRELSPSKGLSRGGNAHKYSSTSENVAENRKSSVSSPTAASRTPQSRNTQCNENQDDLSNHDANKRPRAKTAAEAAALLAHRFGKNTPGSKNSTSRNCDGVYDLSDTCAKERAARSLKEARRRSRIKDLLDAFAHILGIENGTQAGILEESLACLRRLKREKDDLVLLRNTLENEGIDCAAILRQAKRDNQDAYLGTLKSPDESGKLANSPIKKDNFDSSSPRQILEECDPGKQSKGICLETASPSKEKDSHLNEQENMRPISTHTSSKEGPRMEDEKDCIRVSSSYHPYNNSGRSNCSITPSPRHDFKARSVLGTLSASQVNQMQTPSWQSGAYSVAHIPSTPNGLSIPVMRAGKSPDIGYQSPLDETLCPLSATKRHRTPFIDRNCGLETQRIGTPGNDLKLEINDSEEPEDNLQNISQFDPFADLLHQVVVEDERGCQNHYNLGPPPQEPFAPNILHTPQYAHMLQMAPSEFSPTPDLQTRYFPESYGEIIDPHSMHPQPPYFALSDQPMYLTSEPAAQLCEPWQIDLNDFLVDKL
jgi:hypothetical protein